MNDTPPKLTEQTLARLRAYGEGNGVNATNITLIETNESIFTLSGKVVLTPHCDVKSRQLAGRLKSKAYKVHPSFDELKKEVETIQKDFQEAGSWTQEALAELEKSEGHGWGVTGAFLTWSDKTTTLGATENCPTCRGSGQHPCNDCRGLGFTHCHYCQMRGQEQCPQCAGHGIDPNNQKNKCPLCNGTGYVLCQYCQGTMKLHCTSCAGRGNTPCTTCRGKGVMSMEVQVTRGARMDFYLASTSGLPSGLLRGLSRIGTEKICKGHADITLKPTPEDPEAPKRSDYSVILEAKLPYADIKVKVGTKAAIIACFGKQGKLSGVPAYLDEALTPARKILDQAAKEGGNIENAMTTRAIKDAFQLVLSGKTHPDDLRRKYPIGLSPDAAKEIMQNLGLFFAKSTAKTRQIAGGACLVACAAFFGLLFTPIMKPEVGITSPQIITGLKVALPLVALGASWTIMQQAAKVALKKQFKGLTISTPQHIGRTGYAVMGGIVLLYVTMLFLAGNIL